MIIKRITAVPVQYSTALIDHSTGKWGWLHQRRRERVEDAYSTVLYCKSMDTPYPILGSICNLILYGTCRNKFFFFLGYGNYGKMDVISVSIVIRNNFQACQRHNSIPPRIRIVPILVLYP